MNPTTKHVLAILAVCGLTFFWNLGEAKLWDRDEPRNAGCAAEMLVANNWVVPIFNDELRPQKPVLLYWLMMSAYSVFGQNEFAARFWSALLGVGTCLLTYAIGRRMFNATVGWLAAVALATNLMFCVAARAATPDSVLIFCCTLAYWFYIRAIFKNEKVIEGAFPLKAIQWTPFYVSLGLAVLAKGPIGYLIPMAVVGMFMLIERSSQEPTFGLAAKLGRWLSYFAPIHFLRTLWSMRFLVGTVIVLSVAFPWYNAVDTQTKGAFTELFFFKENFERATTTMENHGGGLWFYPLAILVGFFPWSVFAGPTIGFLWSRPVQLPKRRSAIIFLMCWVAIQVVTFSLFSTKLPSYVTPCYPALAILTAIGLVEFSKVHDASLSQVRWHKAAMIALISSGLAITIGIWIGFSKYLPAVKWLAIVGAVPIVGGAYGYWAMAKQRQRRFLVASMLCAVVFCWGLFGVGTVAISRQRKTDQLFERIARHPSQVVGAWNCMEPSWVVYGEKPIYELEAPGDFYYPMEIGMRDEIREMRLKKPWEFKTRPVTSIFLLAFPNSLILTTDEHIDSLRGSLPDSYEILERADMFLKPERKLILLGPREQSQ